MSAEWTRSLPWLAAAVATVTLLYLLAPILMPFVIGAGLAYLGDPLVDRLQARGVSRTGGVVIVFGALSLLGLLSTVVLLPLLMDQAMTVVSNIPAYLGWIQDTALPAIGIALPDGMRLNAGGLRAVIAENWQQASGLMGELLSQATRSGATLLTYFANLLLIPVVTFYLLRDWDDLVAWIRDHLPRRWLPTISKLAAESDAVLSEFIRGQLLVMAALALIYAVGLWIVGLDLALLIGLGAGLVSFVPYLGFIVGILAASLAMLVQTGELLPLIWVAVVFGVGQMAESMLLTPLLVGDRIGLHPVAVIFAIMAGGQLFGFLGVLLALPVAAVLAVLLRHARELWLDSDQYLRP